MDLAVRTGGGSLPAILTLPQVEPTAGIVTLHPATGASRDFFLFRHLAALVAPLGVAVLSYDRRPAPTDDDLPFSDQADDALAAVEELTKRLPAEVPIGLWGFSQGAWAASIAAGRSDRIGFLVLIGASGVSPADQMRYNAAETLRRAGYGTGDIVRAVDARRGVEAFLRGDGSHADAQRAIDSIASESWFDLLYLPYSLAPDATWRDMDYDPIPAIRGVGCPVLLIYGDDEVVPAEASIAAWREGTIANGTPLEVVRLPDSSHLPTLEGATSTEAVDPAYEAAITGWLDRFVTHAATR